MFSRPGGDRPPCLKCVNSIYNIKKNKKIKKTFDKQEGICYYIEVSGGKQKKAAENLRTCIRQGRSMTEYRGE